jgi:aminoacrylate hydrolase
MKTIRRPGIELAYEITGTGPAVLYIQGVGVAGSGWRPQVEALAFQFQVIALDNRGLGHSAWQRVAFDRGNG